MESNNETIGRLYGAREIVKLIGITSDTLKAWAERHLIPEPSRQGLQRKRVWSKWKVKRILEFAKDNGYKVTIPYELSIEKREVSNS